VRSRFVTETKIPNSVIVGMYEAGVVYLCSRKEVP
jgi:hypothetical protein